MSRWDGIDEFIQVVDQGSFTAAADQLQISTSQISKRVAKLEDRLGARLMVRTTRQIRLTEEGEQFYLRCRQAVETFNRAEETVLAHSNQPRGHLKININGCFQDRFIVPILAEFSRQYPKLALQVDFSDGQPNILRSGYDLSICYGELNDSSLVARKLADNYNYLVASPDYLSKHPTPINVDELQEHNCLSGKARHWILSNGAETMKVKISGNWQSDNGGALLNAARSGLGIAQLPFFSVVDDIERGDLVQLLPDWSRYPEAVWIVYAQQRHLPVKLRLLVDFLVTQIRNIQL